MVGKLTVPEILFLLDDQPDTLKKPPPGSTPLTSEAQAQAYAAGRRSMTLRDRIAEARCRL
jgi:hypothetical protein